MRLEPQSTPTSGQQVDCLSHDEVADHTYERHGRISPMAFIWVVSSLIMVVGPLLVAQT